MNSKEQFLQELYKLYIKHNLCISSCGPIYVAKLEEELVYPEGFEINGIEAVKHKLE